MTRRDRPRTAEDRPARATVTAALVRSAIGAEWGSLAGGLVGEVADTEPKRGRTAAGDAAGRLNGAQARHAETTWFQQSRQVAAWHIEQVRRAVAAVSPKRSRWAPQRSQNIVERSARSIVVSPWKVAGWIQSER